MKMRIVICCMIFVIVPMLPLFSDTGVDGNVLLFWQNSDFKDLLARELQDNIPDDYQVTVIEDFSKIKNESFEGYDTIIIINTGVAWHMNKKVKKRITKSPDARIITITTFGDPETSKDDFTGLSNVDAITTASLKDNDEVYEFAKYIWNIVENGNE